MSRGVIALIDGEHHPAAVRDALDDLEASRGLAGVVFCGGEEKLGPDPDWGRPVERGGDPAAALRGLAEGAEGVVDLADEPALPTGERLKLAAMALHLGLAYEAPGMRLEAPRYESLEFAGPKLSVFGTGKRTGKTAVAGHLAGLLRDSGRRPALVCMGRGGPREPRVAEPGTGLEELLALSERGEHAASDYLEGAVLAGVPSVGARRVGGGPAGAPGTTNFAEAAVLAASLPVDALVFEGSGAVLAPVEADGWVCVTNGEPGWLGSYAMLRADLVLATAPTEGPSLRIELRSEPAEEIPAGARVALFATAPVTVDGLEPAVSSDNLARRGALAADVERAVAERCDVWLTELKAAAIDTVAMRARVEGARVVFLRNRPVGVEEDLDVALLELARG